MARRTRLVVAGVGTLLVAAAGTGIGLAATNGDDDAPLAGDAYDRAVAAALAEVGGGTVLETAVGDGGAAYEVEIRLPDGRQIEVHLDDEFRVTGREADEDRPGERDGGG